MSNPGSPKFESPGCDFDNTDSGFCEFPSFDEGSISDDRLLRIIKNDGVLELDELLAKSLPIDYRFTDTHTILHHAAATGAVGIIRTCIIRGLNPNVPTRLLSGHTPLYYAIKEGQTEGVRTLINLGANVTNVHRKEDSPVMVAVTYGHREILEIILEAGLDPNKENGEGMFPLWHTGMIEEKEDMFKMLLNAGANVNQTLKAKGALYFMRGGTVLHLLASSERVELASKVIECGVDVNIQDYNGRTALFRAVWSKKPSLAQLLIETQGCDVNISCPLLAAVGTNMMGLVKILVEHGAEVNQSQRINGPMNPQTPLTKACSSGTKEAVEFLLSHGADPNWSPQGSDRTPMYHAIKYPWYEDGVPTVECLIRYGADVLRARFPEETPLFMAAYLGNTMVAAMLIEQGCDLFIHQRCMVCIKDQTALEVAVSCEQKDTAELLVSVMSYFYDERWLQKDVNQLQQDAGLLSKDQEFAESFWRNVRNPRSLKHLCRHAIRETVKDKVPCTKVPEFLSESKLGRRQDFRQFVLRLPLPPLLIQYVLFSDLVNGERLKRL